MLLRILFALVLINSVNPSSVNDSKLKFFKVLGHFRIGDESLRGKSYVKTYYGSQDFKLSWASAFVFCRQFGMELTMLETEAEKDSFLDMLSDALPSTSNYNKAFIGGSNVGTEDGWYWVSSGEPINFRLDWTDDKSSGNCLNVHLDLMNSTFTFNRASCDSQNSAENFICEKNNAAKWYIA